MEYTLEEKQELTRLLCEDMILREHDKTAIARYMKRIEGTWRTKTK